ncbi:MAG: sulfite exporter TauE/SafE family protein [Kiloniellales bacterium]|nr:sulfite exporter TauE/SafE family protein [Kiloniellales bacterium]
MDSTFAIYVVIGFVAQLIDGALGMAFGVITMSALLSLGMSPAAASASVHLAEVFTTSLSGLSHIYHRNVDWRLMIRLAIPGTIGAVLGAYLLTQVPGDNIRPLIALYLILMGGVILRRALSRAAKHRPAPAVVPLGLCGGFLDATGGGGWGPVVASSLLAWGSAPRFALGSVNMAEFFVCLGASVIFAVHLSPDYLEVVLGLIAGGAISAPLAGYLVKRMPARLIMGIVSILVICISFFVLWESQGR